MGMWECSENIRPAHTLDLNSVSALHEHDENAERVDSSAKAVSKFHTHSIPLDMEDIEHDWDKPVTEAGIAAKASVIVRVGMLDLGAGTGSFRVREMMHRIAYPLGVHVRADVNLTDIEASCTDGKDRITEVVDLPTTGVNTERIWLLEHFADWFNVNLGKGSMYHSQSDVSEGLMQHLDKRDASQVSAELSKQLKERQKAEQNQEGSDDPVLDALEMVTERAQEGDSTARPLHMRDIEAAAAAGRPPVAACFQISSTASEDQLALSRRVQRFFSIFKAWVGQYATHRWQSTHLLSSASIRLWVSSKR